MKNILKTQRIDARDLNYRELNSLIKDAANRGVKNIQLTNVNGQRYIGTGVNSAPKIDIN